MKLLKKLGYELKYILSDIKYLADIFIMILRMNGLNELTKYILVLKKYSCLHYSFAVTGLSKHL